jgi:DNA repair exonuclease SbcCD nuclease subunit
MNNILIFSDEHRNLASLKECDAIDSELISLKEKYHCDTVISLGDNFDTLKPSSQELDQFAKFIKKLNCKFIILAANSHESTTEEESILNHYGILSDNVQIVKEYKDQNHLYCGHYSIKESTKNYDAKRSKEDLKGYLYVFLGHIHSYQLIKPNIVHLGSVRYVNFDEAEDKQKLIALISDYGSEREQVHFLKLKSPYPMAEFILNSNKINKLEEKVPKNSLLEASQSINLPKNKQEGKSTLEGKITQSASTNPPNPSQIDLLCQQLDKLPPKTKIKVKIQDFASFRDFLPLANKYSSKFEVFKYDTDFSIVQDLVPNKAETEKTTFKESFNNWLSKQNIDSKIKDILLKEIE